MNIFSVGKTHRTSDNYVQTRGQKIEGESLTRPDQAYTIPEILLRYSQGQPLPVSTSKNLTMTGDTFIPNVRAMDIIDQMDLIKETQEKRKKLQAEMDRKTKSRIEQQQEYRKQQAAFAKWINDPERSEVFDAKKEIEKAKPNT